MLLFIRFFAVLVEVFEIPMKRNAVNLFSTLILNEDNRYCPKKKVPPGLSLYLLSCKHFSVGTVHFLQQNKSFDFDPQKEYEIPAEQIIGHLIRTIKLLVTPVPFSLLAVQFFSPFSLLALFPAA